MSLSIANTVRDVSTESPVSIFWTWLNFFTLTENLYIFNRKKDFRLLHSSMWFSRRSLALYFLFLQWTKIFAGLSKATSIIYLTELKCKMFIMCITFLSINNSHLIIIIFFAFSSYFNLKANLWKWAFSTVRHVWKWKVHKSTRLIGQVGILSIEM